MWMFLLGLPLLAGPVSQVNYVKTGAFTTHYAGCIVRADDTVACWGGPNLLHDFNGKRSHPQPGPFAIDELAGSKRIVHGPYGTCGLRRDGGVRCWSQAQGKTSSVELGQPATQLAGSSSHYCALLKDGTVSCWGQGANGALGRAVQTPYQNNLPAPVPGVAGAVALAVGNTSACAVRKDGVLLCWGSHPFRESGLAAQAEAIEGFEGVTQVVIGSSDMGCVKSAQGVQCQRKSGGRTVTTLEPRKKLAKTVQMDALGETMCAVTSEGQVWCWGIGPTPYVIDGRDLARRKVTGFGKARRISGIDDAVQVSVAATHACASTKSGHALCWGDNQYGELGDGTLEPRDHPVELIDYHPERMDGPGEVVFGCTADDSVARACMKSWYAGDQTCRLQPPPGYWRYGHRGGARMTDEMMQRELEALKKRPVPACMCTCTDEYRSANQRWQQEQQKYSTIP